MGRQRKLMAAIVGVVVLVTVLVVSTATADTGPGRGQSGSGGPRPGVTLSAAGAPAASGATTPGDRPVTCSHRTGCRGGTTSASTTRHPGGGSSTGSPDGTHGSSGSTAPPTTGGSSGTGSSGTGGAGTATTTQPVDTTTTASTGAAGASGTGHTWWHPATVLAWQWELDHPLDLGSASDMGTGVSTYLGAPAPDPTVYDIDGFDNTAATVSALHARGDHVICYIEVGAAENYRSDYDEFPAADLGSVVSGYSAERYLDIKDPTVVSIIEARIAMCASKGFDAIEPDIDDSYTDSTGFSISEAQNLQYDTTLAAYAHGLGLAWGLKNGDDPGFAAAMEPVADFALDEQCHQYDTCSSFDSFAAAGKAVLEVEYSLSPSQFCPAANAADEDAMAMNVALSGGRQPCR